MNEIAAKLRDKGPIWFCKNVLGYQPFNYQSEIINSIFKYPRVTVKSCNGVGKSSIAARIILSFLYLNQPSVVLSTAPTFQQVERIIWKELRTAYNNANNLFDGGLGGILLPRSPELYLKNNWFAIGLSTNAPERFQGYHEENLLLIVDESSGVKDDIFEASQRILTSENTHILQIGNPNSPADTTGNYFFESFNSPLYKKYTISAFDTPNFIKFGIQNEHIESGEWREMIGKEKLPAPYLITPSWAAEMAELWGIDSAPYYISVLGEYPPEGSNALIPFNWMEKIVW